MNFQKSGNCGSPFEIYTSAILVKQCPPNRIFVYCSMGTVKFELLSWFSIVRDVWRQHFSVLSQKTNNISVVSSHFHLYLRISALRLPTVISIGLSFAQSHCKFWKLYRHSKMPAFEIYGNVLWYRVAVLVFIGVFRSPRRLWKLQPKALLWKFQTPTQKGALMLMPDLQLQSAPLPRRYRLIVLRGLSQLNRMTAFWHASTTGVNS